MAIVLNPKYAEAFTGRGVTYQAKGDYDRAITDFDKAIALNPNDVLAYSSRGVSYGHKDDFVRAIAGAL